MVKRLLIVAALGVLASGCASTPAGVRSGATTVSAPGGRAIQLAPDTANQPATAASPAAAVQTLPPAVTTGHASSQGTTAPQPPGPSPAAVEPTAPSGPQPVTNPTCPTNRHLGIACKAP